MLLKNGAFVATNTLIAACVSASFITPVHASDAFDLLITQDQLIATHPEFAGQIPLPVLLDGQELVIQGFAGSGDIATSRGTLADPAGQLVTVLNTTLNPQTGDPFEAVFEAGINNGRLTFLGLSRSSPTAPSDFNIFYQDTPGGAILPATTTYNGNLPSATFVNSGDHFAYLRNDVIYQFQTNGTPAALVQTGDLVPGAPNNLIFTEVRPEFQTGATTIFTGESGGFEGIYAAAPGQAIQAIVDTNDTMPGTTGAFDSLFSPVADGMDVAFGGEDLFTDDGGIFAVIDGVLQLVANDAAMTAFGYSDTVNFGNLFANDSGYAIEDGRVIFQATAVDFSNKGLYSYTPTEGLTKIIETGDTIDEGVVGDIEFVTNGLSDGNIAFVATYDTGGGNIEVGVFSAAVPEPSSLALLGLGGLMLARRRRG